MPGQQCERHTLANQGTEGGDARSPRPRQLPWGRVDTHAGEHFLFLSVIASLSLFLHDCGTLVFRGTLCGVLAFFSCCRMQVLVTATLTLLTLVCC